MGDRITVLKCLQEKFDKTGLFRAGEDTRASGSWVLQQDKFRAGLNFVCLFEQNNVVLFVAL